jgi:hypothetical protein
MTNKISLENKSSTSLGIDQQDIHKLANGGKVAQALGRINKIYNEITKKIT